MSHSSTLFNLPAQSWFDAALIALLFAASMYDLVQRRIPNRLLLLGLTGAMVLYILAAPGLSLLTGYLAGFMVGLLLFLPLYVLRAMAAGDVKLMATVGAFVGPALALQAALATYVVGGLMAVLMVLALGQARIALANMAALLRPMFLRMRGIPAVAEPMPHASVGQMPYAVAISLGSMAVLWLRDS